MIHLKNAIKQLPVVYDINTRPKAPHLTVTDPANSRPIAFVETTDSKETEAVIEKAEKAFSSWSAKTAKDRCKVLKKWHDLLLENSDLLAEVITLESGKPIQEAKGEVAYGASYVEWFAEEAKRAYGEMVPAPWQDAEILVMKQAIGVVAAITPWNFPVAMITRKVAPALAAGCSIVVKPAEDTPLSALIMEKLALDAGLPHGTLQIVVADNPAKVGAVLTSHSAVKKLSFTGSTAVGKLLMKQCASTVKKLGLELGGNAPFIVFEDADIDAAVAGAIASKYRNAGQTCVCANRFYIQSTVYDEFVEKLALSVQELKLGHGLKEGTTVGPLINQAALLKVSALVEDAKSKGAGVKSGGQAAKMGGNYFEPTILTDITLDMDIAVEEIFGPIAALNRFETEQDVIKLANDTPYGLASYFYARDVGRIFRVGKALEYGMVGVNTGIISTEVAPFGGIKESGLGREGSHYGLDDFMELKYMALTGLGR